AVQPKNRRLSNAITCTKLRTANTDSEINTLQNAITATDRQIDELVYSVYGLTKEEIELVEKG
ncbi:MAG: hypothetical protein MUF78_02990, partial [Candidatus Edwardsbacteria bacterium]|nr:hypothetical protein [Candidatus Edwardsbacteria bacterium]